MKRRLRICGVAGALALAGCAMGDWTIDDVPPPIYTAEESVDLYAWIDRADMLWDAIGDAPPDHAFAFEGAEPWAWTLEDGHRIIVEDGPGGIQSFYFYPGERAPFLAVEPGNSFGFEGLAVAVVYGADGGALPRAAGAPLLERGIALQTRGRQLLQAMERREWRSVDAGAWSYASPLLLSHFAEWDLGYQRHPGWRAYRDRSSLEWRARLTQEAQRRRARADAFRRWRESGFQGPSPAGWQKPSGPRPGADRPRQPGSGWSRPIPGRPRPAPQAEGAPQPAPTPGTRPNRPQRPGVDRPARPGSGWSRPIPGQPRPAPQAEGAPAPVTPPDAGATRPARPGWNRLNGPRGARARPAPQADGAPVTLPGAASRERPGRDWSLPGSTRSERPSADRPRREAAPTRTERLAPPPRTERPAPPPRTQTPSSGEARRGPPARKLKTEPE